MMIGMLLFRVLIIVGNVWAVRELGRSGRDGERFEPLDLLGRRSAEGGITVDEYERRRRVPARNT